MREERGERGGWETWEDGGNLDQTDQSGLRLMSDVMSVVSCHSDLGSSNVILGAL